MRSTAQDLRPVRRSDAIDPLHCVERKSRSACRLLQGRSDTTVAASVHDISGLEFNVATQAREPIIDLIGVSPQTPERP